MARLKKLTAEQVEQAKTMYAAGLSLGAVAAYFQVSRQAMWDLLRRRMELRPQRRSGEANHFFRGGATADDRAHDLVERAVLAGILTRPATCEQCLRRPGPFGDGRPSIQAHHDDYNAPLVVRWLCQPCHHEWHQHNTARALVAS